MKYKTDAVFRAKDNARSCDYIKKKYSTDEAFREKKKAAERERYRKKKAEQSQQAVSV